LTVPRSTPWRKARFAVVDVETTGLDPRRDEVVSFAAVPVDGGRVVASGAVGGLVRPARRPDPASVEVHGLRAADLEAAPAAPAALEPLASLMRGRVPVAHAAWVERAFLRGPLRALGSRMPRRMVDTAELWRLLCIERNTDDPGWCSLGALAENLGLPAHRPHSAEGDALTTAQVFLALATQLERHGRGNVGSFTGARWQLRAFRLWHGPVSRG